jgi:hypothetical protein
MKRPVAHCENALYSRWFDRSCEFTIDEELSIDGHCALVAFGIEVVSESAGPLAWNVCTESHTIVGEFRARNRIYR